MLSSDWTRGRCFFRILPACWNSTQVEFQLCSTSVIAFLFRLKKCHSLFPAEASLFSEERVGVGQELVGHLLCLVAWVGFRAMPLVCCNAPWQVDSSKAVLTLFGCVFWINIRNVNAHHPSPWVWLQKGIICSKQVLKTKMLWYFRNLEFSAFVQCQT